MLVLIANFWRRRRLVKLSSLTPKLIYTCEGVDITLFKLMPQHQVRDVRFFAMKIFKLGDYLRPVKAAELQPEFTEVAFNLG